VLDEPTNDLDIETLELLEALLQDYSGTLFLVSHDRTFLDNLVTQTIVFEGDGKLLEYAGGYEDWRRALQFRTDAARDDTGRAARGRKQATRPAARVPAAARLSYKEALELAALPDRISALEHEQSQLSQRLTDPALYRAGAVQVKALQARLAEIEAELAASVARWEELETRHGAAQAPAK